MLTVKIPARQLILPLRVALFIVAVQKFEISTNGASWTFSDFFYTEQTVTTIAPNLIFVAVQKFEISTNGASWTFSDFFTQSKQSRPSPRI